VTWLLDTNAISELGKPRPNPGLRAWFEARYPDELYTSAVALGELFHGAFKLPATDLRRAVLLRWISTAVVAPFADRILPLDTEVARTWGQIAGELPPGISMDARDAQIAATAIFHGHVLVTRNVRDMSLFGRLVIENPWT
jgi:toxin FitB